jgi:hypothetical protein
MNSKHTYNVKKFKYMKKTNIYQQIESIYTCMEGKINLLLKMV